MAGGRLYILSPEKKVRLYINLLIGGMLNKEEDENTSLNNDPEYGLGLSTGAFLEISRFLVGLSFETLSNVILKAGFVF